ncbi:MAG: hypothetical protein NTU60_06840 [Candidatus Aminicenantes bacterium]|nr:hypothetical protein [Candidatus Aminicenantes bacterium]
MKRFLLWFLAVFITLGAAVYQRLTGPTYPFRARATLDGQDITARLPRSAENVTDCEIKIRGLAPEIGGYVEYMRYKTQDPWTKIPLERSQGALSAGLPKQPAAGKLAYKVVLVKGDKEAALSGDKPIVIRFKGVVPSWVLIPHIIIMFLAMLLSSAAGLAAFGKARSWPKFKFVPGILLFAAGIGTAYAIFKIVGIPKIMGFNLFWLCIPVSIGAGALLAALPLKPDHRLFAKWTAALLFIGGFILGPLVQKYSFGVLWSGVPLGFDLTDNKTLIAMVGWLLALFMMRKGKQARVWVVAAAVLLMAVYSIPHSVLGSELDYSKLTPPAKVGLP